MKFRKYNLGKAATLSTEYAAAYIQLSKAEVANKFIPPDTCFAIIVDAVERNIDESFLEAGISVPTLSFQVTNQGGVVGRFLGYMTATDTKFRIYKMLDLDITKPETLNTEVVGNLQPQLLVEDQISNLRSEPEFSTVTLMTTSKKFRFLAVHPIYGSKTYESKASGVQGGLKQFFVYLRSKGAKVKPQSTFAGILPTLIVIVLIIAFYLFVLKKD